MRAESRHGSIELTGIEIAAESQNWTGRRRYEVTDLKTLEFRSATEFMPGELQLSDQFGGQIRLPFSVAENDAFQSIARRIDDLRHGRGAPLLPITTGLQIPGREILETVDVITSEAVMAMSIFKDVANAWRDAVGGRSKTVQSNLREARELCLWELRQEARRRFADAVIGVDLDYSEFSSSLVSGGMLMVVASGTAVRLAPKA